MNTQIIAIANQKGGVGKTTTCANLGIGLAQSGKKVLLIDGDPQGSLTISLGNPQPDKLPFTLSDAMGRILMDEPIRPGEGILHHPEGVDLMPADIQLSGMEVSLVNAMSRETILRQYLDTLKGQYSHILIDCQPSLGMLTVNALAAANRVIIPVQAEYLPAKGLEQLLQTINKVRRQINPKLQIDGILLTMVDSRTNFAKEISALLRETYGSKIKVFIHSEKDILKLVTTLIANTKGEGKAGDDFWVKAETLLYCALIGYIHYEAPVEEQNFSTLIEFINAMEVREDDEEFKNPVDLMFDALEAEKPNHFAVRQYKKYKLAAGVVCSKRLLNQAVGKSLRTHNLKPKKGAQVMRKNEKITALYERLSRDDFGKDDDQQRESNSISNQKAMLEEFAARQGFTNIVHFTDDGISGTCFDRPGFLAMMKEVEAGNVEYLCIKDMSRMGRDYLKVGQIMEILRQRGVRLIAINDGVDSARGDDDFTPFRNIMNEYYARDTSRKIRSTFQSKGKSGKHLTGTVIYGYLWNEARDQWLVDPEAADVVKRIFAMTIDGYGPYQIASKLKSEKVLIPSAYLAQHGEGVNKNKTFKDVYGWGSSTICNILEKREYLGHTINFKTRKHFKDKKSHYVPEDEWTIFENTHEAIIDQQTFDLVQKIRGNVRRYPDGWGEAAPLTGLLYCADCGGKMYVHRTNNGKRISQYTCSQYSKVPVGKLCTTQHRINEDVVLSLVSEMLKAIAEYAKHDRAEFVRVVQEAQSSQQTAEVRKQRTRLATAKQRVSELEVLLCKIYEDNILGKLSDSRYATLDAQYEKEQSELTAEISVLEKAVKSYEKHEKDADRFIALIDKYENFDKLTIAMLNEFIEKILVHERDRKGSIQTTQEVEIYFNFVGRFVPPAFGEVELTPEELEEIRKREERKDRLHQNYLKRKASGAQKRYEDKIKGRKKAEIEAKKAAIRAEDIAKGVFVPVSSLPQREPMKGVQTA
ncbi:MAG: AAA family ATPase [Faecalibacterium prausnitzii]